MPKSSPRSKKLRLVGGVKAIPTNKGLQGILWRLDRLERQVQTLSELVRDHAEDADRLVRIVGEDREVLRQQLLRDHQARLRVRRHGQDPEKGEPTD